MEARLVVPQPLDLSRVGLRPGDRRRDAPALRVGTHADHGERAGRGADEKRDDSDEKVRHGRSATPNEGTPGRARTRGETGSETFVPTAESACPESVGSARNF